MIHQMVALLRWQFHKNAAVDILLVLLMICIFVLEFQYTELTPVQDGILPWDLEDSSPLGFDYWLLLGEVIGSAIILYIFGRRFYDPLDNRIMYGPIPLEPDMLVATLIIQVFIVNFMIGLTVVVHDYLLSLFLVNSMTDQAQFNYLEWFDETLYALFVSCTVAFSATLRPLHYVVMALIHGLNYWTEHHDIGIDYRYIQLLICLLCSGFSVIFFRRAYQPSITMSRSPVKKRLRSLTQRRQFQLIVFVLLLTPLFMLANRQEAVDVPVLESIIEARNKAISAVEGQEKRISQYFTYVFHKADQAYFDQLITVSDRLYEDLCAELNVEPSMDGIHIFIRESEDHLLGSANGKHVVLNTATLSSEDLGEIKSTFRHELAHVIINQLADYRFEYRKDILGAFIHEGIAELIENYWQAPDDTVQDSLALTTHSYDRAFTDIVKEAGWFAPYDYGLHYSYGHLFWYEFHKQFGRESLIELIQAIGRLDDIDQGYASFNFLYLKAQDLGMNLSPVVAAVTKHLQDRLKRNDLQQYAEVLQHIKFRQQEDGRIIIPYHFAPDIRLICEFRAKSKISSTIRSAEPMSSGTGKGYVCESPGDYYRMALSISKTDQWWYRTPWMLPE